MRRNKFNLSHYRMTSFDMGLLIPTSWVEVNPGDSIQWTTSALIRLSPLVRPVMHPLWIKMFAFFIPYRVIWDDWEDFITGGEDGLNASVHPYEDTLNTTESTMYHYLGKPIGNTGSLKVNALPLRAYNTIWNTKFRDQQLQNEVTVDTTDGDDTSTFSTPLRVCWEKDYYTTARPSESLGSDVTVPIYGTGADGVTLYRSGGGAGTLQDDGTGDVVISGTPSAASLLQATDETHSHMDIDDLKLGLGLQRFQERMNKHGARYHEYVQSLGVRGYAPPDEPVYLGGGRRTVSISEIASTDDGGTAPVGTLAGHGIGAIRTRPFRKFFKEHGMVMSLIVVQPKAVYTDAMERKWFRTTKEDYFQPELQFIGDQAILNKEVRSVHATPEGTFGYQERYSEYKHALSTVSGNFADTDDDWHYARQFGTDPALNSDFVTCTPAERAHADATEHTVKAMISHQVVARRPMARSPKPGSGL